MPAFVGRAVKQLEWYRTTVHRNVQAISTGGTVPPARVTIFLLKGTKWYQVSTKKYQVVENSELLMKSTKESTK